MNNLALSYDAVGRHADALRMQVETLAFRQRVLPCKHHPDIVESLSNLAHAYSICDQHEDALQHQQEALSLYRLGRSLGSNNSTGDGVDSHSVVCKTADMLSHIALSQSMLHRGSEALDTAHEALAMLRSTFPRHMDSDADINGEHSEIARLRMIIDEITRRQAEQEAVEREAEREKEAVSTWLDKAEKF